MNMEEQFYRILIRLSRLLGNWVFIVLSRIVAAGYFLFFPSRRRASINFYRNLFKHRHRSFYTWCAFRQFMEFTNVFLDRFLLSVSNDFRYVAEGWEYLEDAMKKKTGAVIVMSHMGNWEIAAHLFKKMRPTVPFLLYMGTKQKEQIERLQKQSLMESGITIVTAGEDEYSVFDFVDAASCIQNGGMVSITGDILRTGKQKSVTVEFLGRPVEFPAAPYILAMATGVPLFVFFSLRTGNLFYRISCTAPIYIKPEGRKNRNHAIKEAARQYATILEEKLVQYPYQWFHFTDNLKGGT